MPAKQKQVFSLAQSASICAGKCPEFSHLPEESRGVNVVLAAEVFELGAHDAELQNLLEDHRNDLKVC